MKSKPSVIRFLVPALAFLVMVACELDVPVKEMIEARTAIEDAKKYGADQFAAEEIGKAESLLLRSHDDITSDKADDAKKAAVESYSAAIEAQKKCLPKYAAEQIRKTDEAYDAAEKAYAEMFSIDNFTEAGKLNKEAKGLYESGDYRKSSEVSAKAYKLAVAARDESLENSSTVKDEVAKAEERLAALKGNEYSSSAEGNLTSAETAIGNAKKGMTENDYRAAFQMADMADKELDAAEKIIKKNELTAKIQSLRGDMDEIRGGKLSDDAAKDLDSAMLELNGAETALEQDNISDAELKIEQAEKLIAGSNEKIKKGNAAAAIEKAEKLLAQAREKDTGGKYKENLDKGESLITGSKTSAESGNFNDAIAGAGEAETIISAVLNSMESGTTDINVEGGDKGGTDTGEGTDKTVTGETENKDGGTDGVGEKKSETGKTYVVQWRKKNTDCLWRISQKVYKDASLWPAIYLANRDQIKDPDLIFPGQKFVIPPKPKKRPHFTRKKEQAKEKAK